MPVDHGASHAIISSCGMRGALDAIARSTLARNHASYAAASSPVANSDSMGVRSAVKQLYFFYAGGEA